MADGGRAMERPPGAARLAEWVRDDDRRLVRSLGHHIRSPLSTIKSGLQLIQLQTKPGDENAVFLESMLAEVSRIDDALRAAQRYADLDAGSPRPTAAAELVARAAQTQAVSGGAAGARPAIVTPGPPCSVLGDPDQLSLALVELIANATRVSPPDAPVTVGWEALEAGFVRIHVDDEGPGVTAVNEDRILQPFFSSSAGRLGLGLNTVQKLCRLAGGRLEWCNRAGVGCRFTMVLREA